MYKSPTGSYPPELDLERLAAALRGIYQSIRRIPHFAKVAKPLKATIEELEKAQRVKLEPLAEPLQSTRTRKRYAN